MPIFTPHKAKNVSFDTTTLSKYPDVHAKPLSLHQQKTKRHKTLNTNL